MERNEVSRHRPSKGIVGAQSFLMLLSLTAPTMCSSHAILPCHKPTLHTERKVPTYIQCLPPPLAPTYRFTQHQRP